MIGLKRQLTVEAVTENCNGFKAACQPGFSVREECWYLWWDSNPQSRGRLILSQMCIPFHHRGSLCKQFGI
jgi:hypothetical protein